MSTPVITKQPESVTAYTGQDAVFTVEVSGDVTSYCWYAPYRDTMGWAPLTHGEKVLGGTPVGSITSTLHLRGLSICGQSKVYCRIEYIDDNGKAKVVESAVATITVLDSNLAIKTPNGWRVGSGNIKIAAGKVVKAKHAYVKTEAGWTK